jgi:thiol-disulfide isomerase/thioredoxin
MSLPLPFLFLFHFVTIPKEPCLVPSSCLTQTMRTFLLCSVVLMVVALAAAPPLGKRSRPEIKELRSKQQHTLHEEIDGVLDLPALHFNHYLHPRRTNKRGRYWLVVFYASWCHVCDELIEPLTQLANALHNDQEMYHHRKVLSIGKHDVTADEGVAHKYKVDAYPTVLFYDIADIDRVTRFEGKITYEALAAFIYEHTDHKIALPGSGGKRTDISPSASQEPEQE